MVINEATFKFFYQNYNGGPEIVIGAQDDIYSNILHISKKDFFLYSTLKEAESNSVDESNLSEMNNTDLSTRFVKNPSSSNLNKTKTANKIRNLNNNKNENKTNNNSNNYINQNLQNQPKELSLINEGNEVSLLSKEDDPSLFSSNNLNRIDSGNSNSIQVEDDSMENIKNQIDNTKNFISRANYLVLNSNNNNSGSYNNVNSNLINLKLNQNPLPNINNNNNNHILIHNPNNIYNRDDLQKNSKNNFTSNPSLNLGNEVKSRSGTANSNNKNIIIRQNNSNRNLRYYNKYYIHS